MKFWKKLNSIDGLATVKFSLAECLGSYYLKNYIQTLRLPGMKLTQLSLREADETIREMSNDNGGATLLFIDEDMPVNEGDVADIVQKHVYDSLCRNELLGIFNDKKLQGVIFVQENVEDSSIQFAPYVFRSARGQGVMKKAYTGLASAYADVMGKVVTSEETFAGNESMKALFKSIGLVQLNEGPCYSHVCKKQIDFFVRPD